MDKAKFLWLALCARLDVQRDSHQIYRMLADRYAEPHRKYHTLSHVEQCLNEFVQVRHLFKDPDAAEFAIWFHDAVYNTHSSTNEEDSAKLGAFIARSLSLPNSFIDKVTTLILATKHDSDLQNNTDAQLLADIDLSIFGQTREVINEYEKQIRAEYDWVDLKVYIRERSRILHFLINKSSIFYTNFFRNKYTEATKEVFVSINNLQHLTK